MPRLTKTDPDQASVTDADVGLLVDEFERRGLRVPAAFLLDAHRPLLPLMRQIGTFGSPLIRPLLGARRWAGLQRLLDDPAAFDDLVSKLERRPAGREVT